MPLSALSFRWRIALWYSLAIGTLVIALGVLVYVAATRQSLRHHDDSLRTTAQETASILEDRSDSDQLSVEQRSALNALPHLLLIRRTSDGEVVYRSPALDSPELSGLRTRSKAPRPGETFVTLRPEGVPDPLRVYTLDRPGPNNSAFVVEAMDFLGDVNEPLFILGWVLIGTVPLALLAAGGIGWWLAGRVLQPVDQVTRAASQIGITALSRRLPTPRHDDELGRLVNTFNGMIGRLEASVESMQRFTADASHELRTPLTTVRNMIDVALTKNRDAQAYRRVLAELVEEVERLTQLTEGLLTLAQGDACGPLLERTSVQLAELVADVADTLRPLAEARGITLTVTPAENFRIDADPRWLRQMMYNLIDNAVKYSNNGGEVRVSVESAVGGARIRVSDTGPGIPEDDQARVFERFYRVQRSRNRDSGGAGLGLAITQWIVRSHGGTIEVDSRLGQGSTFSVCLPFRSPLMPL